MSISQADIYEAINTAWDESGLDDLFKSLWSDSVDSTLFPTLHDQEAQSGQPFPYCVIDVGNVNTLERMAGGEDDGEKRETRELEVTFNIFTDTVAGDTRSAKQIAADLVEEVMKVFGGHPTQKAGSLSLNYGNHLITQYQKDYSMHVEDDKYQWVLVEKILIDVPLAV